MNKFGKILDMAASHHGSREAVLGRAKNDHFVADYASQPADRLLAAMTKCVFSAGFNWKVIEAKWDGFEEAFEGFDPAKLAFFGDEMMDTLVSDTRIIRNGQKIRATLENAKFVADVERETGSFAGHIAGWPSDDQIGLMAWLHKKGSRLGGATAQYFLRFSGWDSWISSAHVCAALMREGVLDKGEARTKGDLAKVQAAFNTLRDESGLPYAQISKVLALSTG